MDIEMRDSEKEYCMQEVEERICDIKLEIGSIKYDLKKFKKGRKFTLADKILATGLVAGSGLLMVNPSPPLVAWLAILLIIDIPNLIIPKYKAYVLSVGKESKLDRLHHEKEQLKELSKYLENKAGSLMQKMGQLDAHGMQVIECIIAEYEKVNVANDKVLDADGIAAITQFLIETNSLSMPIEETQLGQIGKKQSKSLKKQDKRYKRF